MRWPFFNWKRLLYTYDYTRARARHLLKDYYFNNILMAPCGNGLDLQIITGIATEYYGIDLIPQCPDFVKVKQGDILQSGYDDGFFDCVTSFFFFHHLHKVGFLPFLTEFHRILKTGGILCIIDDSDRYPIGWLMDLGRKIFGNISGLVPDEHPIDVKKLKNDLQTAGFSIISFQALCFSHNRIPIPIQIMINYAMRPFEKSLAEFAWASLYICKKI